MRKVKFNRWLQVRIDLATERKADKVAEAMRRDKSDMVRLLIDEAYHKLVVAPKDGNSQIQPQPAAEVPAPAAA